jgi:hypothetical protein
MEVKMDVLNRKNKSLLTRHLTERGRIGAALGAAGRNGIRKGQITLQEGSELGC